MHGVKSYKFEYKLSTEADYKLGKEITSSKNSCNYTYIDLTQEVVNNLKVTATDNKGNTKDATLDVTPDIQYPMNPDLTDTSLAGKKVNYTPKAGQVYNTEGKMSATASGSDEYSGSSFQYFETSDLINEWCIWGIDDDYVYVISNNATNKSLNLKGAKGYNNAVTLLDKICDTCYVDKDRYPEMKAQNLKYSQILANLTEEWQEEVSRPSGSLTWTVKEYPTSYVLDSMSEYDTNRIRETAYNLTNQRTRYRRTGTNS